MNMREADERAAAEKKRILASLEPLSLVEKRALINAAASYRSGADSCGSVYMGAMAIASLCQALGDRSMIHSPTIAAMVDRANQAQIEAALEVCAPIISYMISHPVKNCPCCGQIMPADQEPRGT